VAGMNESRTRDRTTDAFVRFCDSENKEALEEALGGVLPVLFADASRLRLAEYDAADLVQETVLTALEMRSRPRLE